MLGLLAADVTNSNFEIQHDGTSSAITVISKDGSAFDLELKVTNTPVATTATTNLTSTLFRSARLLSFTGAVPAASWQLEIDDVALGGFMTESTSAAAALQGRFDKFVIDAPATFAAVRLGAGTTSEFLIMSAAAVALPPTFEVRVTSNLVAAGSATSSQTLTLSGTPNTNVNWTAVFDGNTAANTPASDGQTLTSFTDEFVSDISDLANFTSFKSGADKVIIVKRDAAVITGASFNVEFITAPVRADLISYTGDPIITYETKLRLDPAVAGDSSVTSNDRWVLDLGTAGTFNFTGTQVTGGLTPFTASVTNLSGLAGVFATAIASNAEITSAAAVGNEITIIRGNAQAQTVTQVQQTKQRVTTAGAGAQGTPALNNSHFYLDNTVLLRGSWTSGTLWTVTIDSQDYSYTAQSETNLPNTLGTVAFKLAEKINADLATLAGAGPVELEASAAGETITILRASTAPGAQVPFTLDVSRGTGSVRVLVDIDDANRIEGGEDFSLFGGIFGGIFGFTMNDFVEFEAKPTVDLFKEVGGNLVKVVPTLDRTLDTITDNGSDFSDDPFHEYSLDVGGTYYIVIGSEVNYNEFSTIFGSTSPFPDARQGVAIGQTYSAVVSIPGQETNPAAVTLDDTRLEFSDGQGVGQSGTIVSYDPINNLFIVDPDDSGIDPWVETPDQTSRFDIFELPSDDYFANIIRDEYTIRLSKSPDAPVIIDLLPERTRTYNADEAFNPVVFYGEQNEVQVRLATQQAQIRVTDTDVSSMTLTLTIGITEYTITGNSLADLKAAIDDPSAGGVESRLINAAGNSATAHTTAIIDLSAVITGNDLTLTHATERFYTELETASRVATYNGNQIDVELAGVIEAGQDWTLQLGGNTLVFKVVSSTTDRDSLGQWIQSGNDFTWTALANSGARLTTITTSIEDLIESAPELVDYSVTRNGRIMNISQAADFTSTVSVTNNGAASTSGGISIQPIHAQVVQQVVLDSSNYLSGVAVGVEAIDDDFIDGGDALVFAAFEERINSIRGPLTINGGFGESDERFLNNPILYPGETNEPLADGLSQIVGSLVIPELVTSLDNGSRAFIEDLFATHINPNTGLRPGFDPRMNDFLYTVEFLEGRAKGGVYRVLQDHGVSQDIFSVGNSRGLNVDWGASQSVIDTYFQTQVTLLTSEFLSSSNPAAGETISTFNSGAGWSQTMLTFKGNAATTESWTINLTGGTSVSTQIDRSNNASGAINTLGRGIFNLRDQINATADYKAEVRVGLLGEVNLLIEHNDGDDFSVTASRTRTNDPSSIENTLTMSGFLGDDPPSLAGNVVTTYALFAKRDQDFSALTGQSLSLSIDYTDTSGAAQTLTQPINISGTANIASVLNDIVSVVAGTSAESVLNSAISGRRVAFESDWLTNQETGNLVKPLLGDAYYYAPLNANFDVEEADQVDVLNVSNGNSPSNDSGTLTGDRLTGFGMGGDTVIGGRLLPGGITYTSLEELNIELGTGNDSLVIEDTHAGKTTINAGEGDDVVAIGNTSGTLNIEGDAGDDTIHIATSDLSGNITDAQGRLETIMGHLLFDGGAGTDRMTVDDSNDSSAEVGTLTEDSLTGYGFGSVSEVQTLTVIGQSGFYRISRGDVNVPWYYIRPGVARPGSLGVVLDVRFSSVQIQQHLEYIYGFGNVAVSLISTGDGAKTYGIEFIGQLAGADVAPIRWADPGPINLVANGDLGTINAGEINLPNANSNKAGIEVGTRTSAEKDPSGGNTQQFLEIVNADRGTFTITLLDQATAPLPFGVTLEKLIDALQPILNPNNSDPSKPFTNNFDIVKIGNRFLLTFKGEHRDLSIAGVDIDVSNLRGATVELTTRETGISYFNLEQFDLTLGDGANVLNIQGSSATTNVDLGGGNDEIYISSLSDLDFTKRDPSFIGNLDRIRGTLNIDGGTGDQRLLISDASSLTGDFVSIINRPPFRGLPGQDLTNLDASAELFVIGASPAPISIQADRVEGTFREGFRIETGAGDDTVNITNTIYRNRIANAAELELDTGLGNDDVFATLTESGNSDLIIRTQGEFNYRMILRSGLNIADLTNPEDEIAVFVDGVRLGSDQFRAVLGQNAIDLKIDGNLSRTSVVEVKLARVTRGRISEVQDQRQYVVNYQLHSDETVKLFSAGLELRQGADYFFYQLRPQQFILVFNGRFNFFRNGDIVWEATRYLIESQTVQSLGQRDDDFVNASGSTLPLTISSGSGDDVIIGGQNDDVIRSGRGDDIVFGRSGSDIINTVEANQLTADQDIVFGDHGRVSYLSATGEAFIDSRSTGQKRLPSGDYRLLEVSSVNSGTAGDDVIVTGKGNDILIGGFGADRLTAGEGNDVLIGDGGRVSYDAGHFAIIKSTDSFQQDGTNDILSGGDGQNWIIGGLGNDQIDTGSVAAAGDFSTVLGDIGKVTFTYDPGTGINSVTEMVSTFPGVGGNDRIELSGAPHWVIAGSGSDKVITQNAAYIATGTGRLNIGAGGPLAYHDWTLLTSSENSQGGTLITVSGYLVEENLRPLPLQLGTVFEL